MKISHSACSTFLDCGFKYFLHYFRKLRSIEEKSSFAFGAAIDSGLNHLLETRDLGQSTEIFKEQWKKHKDGSNIHYSKADLETHLLTEEQLKLSVKEQSWQSLHEKGIIILEEYNLQVMPRIDKVIKVQLEGSVKNDVGDELTIKTDFIATLKDDKRVILFDNKTSSVKYEEDSVRTSPQLATYYEALKDEYKIDACGYIVIPKKINKLKKPRINIEVLIDNVDEKTIEETFANFENVLVNVKAANFQKNENSCINKFGKCQYYNYCKHNDSSGLVEK